MKYLFGPVNSRRLGISLGIDLLPYKTCSLDCIYCECNKTTNLTAQIDEYVPTEDVIAEINHFLHNKPKLDVITFAGSGEPTLHSGIGKIIRFLKKSYPQYKICILTNSTLLNIKKIRKSILDADIIVPSLDAASKEIFEKITRPAKEITVEKIIESLIALRKEFKNTLILEIFIVPGLNDNERELNLIKNAIEKISPDYVQLNSLDRPGTEKWIKSASAETLLQIKAFLEPLKVEIVSMPKSGENVSPKTFTNITDILVSTLSRRPSTLDDLIISTGISRDELLKTLHDLSDKGRIEEERISRGIFYKVKK